MSELLLKKLRELRQREAATGQARPPHPAAAVFGSALEAQTDSRSYYWHGLKRGGDPAHPFVLFQYTLSGHGVFVQESHRYTMQPYVAFTALIPSQHHYYLPKDATEWTFFWLIIRHPYLVSRLAAQLQESGPVLELAPDGLVIRRAVEVLEQLDAAPYYDPFAEEEALFRFLIAYERAVFQQQHPQTEREQLLQSARQSVLRALPEPVEVEQLAEQHEMSRSAFSHHFRSVTGLTPGHYLTQVRLEEAASSLLQTHLPLPEIAERAGFASATHFCRVFRRHYQLSPGEFRRQMHGRFR